jgi:hypothetical protein
MRLKDFVETTNGYLSYIVTADLSKYRKCPECGLVFVRIKGCDKVRCGDVPMKGEPKAKNHRALTSSFVPNGSGWSLQFLFEGRQVALKSPYSLICNRMQVVSERESEIRGAGCAASLNWSRCRASLHRTSRRLDVNPPSFSSPTTWRSWFGTASKKPFAPMRKRSAARSQTLFSDTIGCRLEPAEAFRTSR